MRQTNLRSLISYEQCQRIKQYYEYNAQIMNKQRNVLNKCLHRLKKDAVFGWTVRNMRDNMKHGL